MSAFSDRELEQRIVNAQSDIKSWAEKNDLWYDSGFTSYAERVQGEPGEDAVVFILYSSGDLARMLDEDLNPPLRAELDEVCESHGFWFENNDGCSYYFYATTDELQAVYDQYFHSSRLPFGKHSLSRSPPAFRAVMVPPCLSTMVYRHRGRWQRPPVQERRRPPKAAGNSMGWEEAGCS